MKVEDFKSKNEHDLLQSAQQCFDEMDTAGYESKAALLLQAQIYMNQAEKQIDSRVARRDFGMEVAVIVLIGVEIVLSIIGIVISVKEGKQQSRILNSLNKSASATAAASQVQAQALPQLIDEQTKSLASLKQMNTSLQDSVQRTTAMSTAVQKQLKIVQDEQAARLAELSKKPKLELYVGNALLNSDLSTPITSKELTPTKVTFDIHLRNSGDASATKGLLRITVKGRDISLDCTSPFQRVYETELDSPLHAIIISFEYLRPGVNIPMSISASYPPGQLPFPIVITVDADELPAGTPLGLLTVTPPKL